MSYVSQRTFRTDSVRFFRDCPAVEQAATNLKRLREGVSPRLSIRALAERLGMPASSYAFYEDPGKFKKPYLPLELARQLAAVLTPEEVDTADVFALAGITKDLTADAPRPDGPDTVGIASIDMAYGMGGTFADGPVEVDVLHFPRAWVETLTATPAALLTWARGRGDSMGPTIGDGDLVLIDRSERTVRDQDAIWAFTMGDIGMMKRLRIRGDKVTILSDNDRVPPDYAEADEINIVGRVAYVVRRI